MAIDPAVFGNSGMEKIMGSYVENEVEEDPLGRNAFLTMLVAQLEHQDPLNPLDGTDFTAQLAQFSGLEQQFETNDNLESILKSLNAKLENEDLLDYIGKQVSAENNILDVKDGEPTDGYYTIEDDGEVRITIYNSNGNPVYGYHFDSKNAGTHNIDWDGKDFNNNPVPDGNYIFKVTTTDANQQPMLANTTASGLVTGINYKGGLPYLVIDDILVDPSAVTEVMVAEDEESIEE